MKNYRKALVLGLGSSGAAAAQLLAREGVEVVVIDQATSEATEKRAALLRSESVDVRVGTSKIPDSCWDVCVVSPGISIDSDLLNHARMKCVEVIGELELGASRCKCPILAITGSNGKSSLVRLCADALLAKGLRVELTGNWGKPICEFAEQSAQYDWAVVEVSSFQLETVSEFRPKVGILLNVNPNHLNRHGSMETYERLKARLFSRMRSSETAIVPARDLEWIKNFAESSASWKTFGELESSDYRYADGFVHIKGTDRRVDISGTMFDNQIMGLTASSAAAAMDACRVELVHLEKAAREFKPLPHRMNRLGKVKGVSFIDDSKATNLGAMIAALQMCDSPVRLVAGGQLKEPNLAPVKKLLAGKVRCTYLIGEAAQTMKGAWEDAVPCRECVRLEEAFQQAWQDAQDGDTILLSPGCASFDQFTSYAERGEVFVKLFSLIKGEKV